ncbi:hypothetical protein [Myceligenerans xiligouense]|uniref:hypothetical protein n=1 Tax=Myceligenerans xiligouense TaxID=253184 RepID=UPI000F4DE288|nr:hypothetical protein [Myceligenerans xiligouense]
MRTDTRTLEENIADRNWSRRKVGHPYGHAPGGPDVPAPRGVAEIEAEFVAAFVLAAHGVDSSDYTIPYVSTWASDVKEVDPVTAVHQTAPRVRTIALQILDGLDTQQVSDGVPPGLDRSAGRAAPAHDADRKAPAASPTPAQQAPASGHELTRRRLPPKQAPSPARNDGIGR